MIFSVVAVVVFGLALAFERQNLGRNPIEKISIVADGNDSAFVSSQRLLQRLARRNVQVICRLIEHQHVHARIDKLRQGQSSLLSAGEIADMFVNIVASE